MKRLITLMISESDALLKIRIMVSPTKEEKGLIECLMDECERLIRSGGVNLEEAENNYRVPKIVLYAALLNEAEQYRPLTPEDRKAAENLTHF